MSPASEEMARAWPAYRLRVRTPRLELRAPTDEEALAVVRHAVDGGVLAPEVRHHLSGWTTAASPELERESLRHVWRSRAEMTPEAWRLVLAAFPAERPQEAIGFFDLAARGFPVTRTVTTGSWLLREWAGRGLGKEGRAAALELAFRGLGATEARSEAVTDNAASNGVSRSLGDGPDGTRRIAGEDGTVRTLQRWVITPDRWRTPVPVEITGVEDLREVLAIDVPA